MSAEMREQPALTTGHVGINVSELARSKEFYTQVFGFDVFGESTEPERRYVFLGTGEKLVLTLWEQSAGRFESNRAGLHHLSFQAESLERVEAIEKTLRGLGAKVYHDGIVAHAEGRASGGVFFEDPDGTRLEVFAAVGVGEAPAPSGSAPTCGFF